MATRRERQRPIYANPAARSWTPTPPATQTQTTRAKSPEYEPEQGPEDRDDDAHSSAPTPPLNQVRAFHVRLPGFQPTPLVPLSLNLTGHGSGAGAGVLPARIFVKDESLRLGLPAYKILGASWGVWRAVAQRLNLGLESARGRGRGGDLVGRFELDAELEQVARAAREAGLVLFAATDGNFGRAVARMGALLGVEVRVYVPEWVGGEVRGRIEGEGEGTEVYVVVVPGDYDDAVARASADARAVPAGRGVHVQDSAFAGYEEITRWVVEGYGTMMAEVQEQLAAEQLKASVIVVPVGAGSLCHAVVVHGKSDGRGVQVLAVEPDRAACLHESLVAGRSVAVEAEPGIMDGLTCPTVSPVSWPVLKAGVDASVTVSDGETHRAVQYLAEKGVRAGPCGGAALAGLRRVAEEAPEAVGLGPESVVVILCTEGVRHYDVPEST